MVHISEDALQHLREFRERNGRDGCVRIGIMSGSSSGASLGISVDDQQESDSLFSFDDLEIIIDSALMKYCESIDVEYILQEGSGCARGGGFRITAKNSV